MKITTEIDLDPLRKLAESYHQEELEGGEEIDTNFAYEALMEAFYGKDYFSNMDKTREGEQR